MYTPVNSSFHYIKVGFKGIKIILAYFRDVKSQVALYYPFSSNVPKFRDQILMHQLTYL